VPSGFAWVGVLARLFAQFGKQLLGAAKDGHEGVAELVRRVFLGAIVRLSSSFKSQAPSPVTTCNHRHPGL
jgi:hypothetical protein